MWSLLLEYNCLCFSFCFSSFFFFFFCLLSSFLLSYRQFCDICLMTQFVCRFNRFWFSVAGWRSRKDLVCSLIILMLSGKECTYSDDNAAIYDPLILWLTQLKSSSANPVRNRSELCCSCLRKINPPLWALINNLRGTSYFEEAQFAITIRQYGQEGRKGQGC